MRVFFPFRIALIVTISAIFSSAQGQDIDTMKTWSVEEFAQKMTDQMNTRVPLGADQVDNVHRINLKFAEQVMPVVNGSDDVKNKVAQVKEIDALRSKELEVFLSPEQMRQVRQIQYENRKKMKQRYHEKNP